MSGDEQFHAWTEILYSIQTGKKAFDKVFGKPIFDYLGEHLDKAQIFDAAMVGIHGRESAAVQKAYDFSGINTVVDIGGGNGSQLIALLKANPTMRGILFDLPHVIERAKAPIAAAGLADRCELVAGSFFETVPAGADAYFMRHIIHDWEDEKSLTILRNCHRAMPAHGRLLVVESVIPPGNEPFGGKFLDLVMLLIPGGKERTEDEYRALFAASRLQPLQNRPHRLRSQRHRSRQTLRHSSPLMRDQVVTCYVISASKNSRRPPMRGLREYLARKREHQIRTASPTTIISSTATSITLANNALAKNHSSSRHAHCAAVHIDHT